MGEGIMTIKGARAVRRGRGAELRAAKGDTEGGLTPRQKAEVMAIEAKIRNRKTEVAYAVNANGRSTRLSEKGTRTRARVDSRKMNPGDVLVHNHPAFGNGDLASRVGISLSSADIRTAIRNNLGGVRAAYPSYQYDLRPGKGGWGVNHDQAANEWTRIYNGEVRAARSKMTREAVGGAGRERLQTILNRLNATASHRATAALAKKYGWTYTRRSN